MIEQRFDIPFVSGLALREKQIQQNYRPLIAVHKWFARRPGSLFRALLLSEFVDTPLRDAYYASHDLPGVCVADPFMGGGTPLMEANRVGCDVLGCDINPMSYWIVRQEIEHLDLQAYREAADALRRGLEDDVGRLYRTTCAVCGDANAHTKYFLWVKTISCGNCGRDVNLFPGYLLAEDRRHPKNVVVCPKCGDLSECGNRSKPGTCRTCGAVLQVEGPAKRGRCSCPHCATMNAFPQPDAGPPGHTLFAIEYHCPVCRPTHKGRFFKKPDQADMDRVTEAKHSCARMRLRYAPDDLIPPGDETDRLHRWGYRRYREMFNARQLLGLETICRRIAAVRDERIRNALATNLSDLLRYQNMLCRYDAMALKSLDIFSVHGFPVGLIQCESNLLGITHGSGDGNVGSGGWSNIVDKYARAKEYCASPFEFRHEGNRKTRVDIAGEWIGDSPNGRVGARSRGVAIICGNAAKARVVPRSLDAVFTDPPYFGNVQYAELMDFCYVWLRKLVDDHAAKGPFGAQTTRTPDEITGNASMGRGLDSFTAGLSSVFRTMVAGLKPGAPLAFTYHHNELSAYYPVVVALLDAGLVCSGTLPCPAEMGASIHISGTGSSIVDTVFVCRTTGTVPKRWIARDAADLARLVGEDLERLRFGGVQPTVGDARCLAFGHMARMAAWSLRTEWCADLAVTEKLAKVSGWMDCELGGAVGVLKHLNQDRVAEPAQQWLVLREKGEKYGARDRQVPF